MAGISNVKNIYLILSGKGGVGKSTTTVQLALSLSNQNKRVGILDLDLCGPSIGLLLGVNKCVVESTENGYIPLKTSTEVPITVMSIAFLLTDKESPLIWRGPRKTLMVKRFIEEVEWGNLDYLLIDTPPGTSDEHISCVEILRDRLEIVSAILITTPQIISVNDVRREITFCKKAQVSIMGIIENMSGYVCPNCSHCSNIFSSGGGESLAKYAEIPFLGAIPIDPNLCESCDLGKNYIKEFEHSITSLKLKDITLKIINEN